MIKQLVSASVGMAVWAAVAAEGARPQPDLVASVELASFSDVQRKIVDLGATINNPAVSMMAVPALQNALTEKFGNFRSDTPMKLLCYADIPTIRKAMAADSGEGLDDAVEPVFLFPCSEGAATFLVNHPEAEKKPDGTIALEDGNVVVFAADGRTCAFASKAEAAKRALATALSPAASRPLLSVEVTEAGLALLADIHKGLIDETAKAQEQDALMSMLSKLQQTTAQRQNAALRRFSRLTMILDLDETGFVVKGAAAMKPGVAVSPAAGFKLPAGALDALPPNAPVFFALNNWNANGMQSADEYRALIADVCAALDAVPATLEKKKCQCTAVVAGLCTAARDYLKAVPCPAPTDWSAGALAFGPKEEPYMAGTVECAELPKVLAACSQGYAAVAATIEKAWPGILAANGTRLSIDWNRLVDVVCAELAASQKGPVAAQQGQGAAQKDLAQAEQVKASLAAVLGGAKSEIVTEQSGPTTSRYYGGPQGFTPPAATPACESRLAAALPEVAANRPNGVFYLALYSLVRDHALPIALKVIPAEDQKEIRSVMGVLPPAGANGAIACAAWSEKDGSSRLVLRITKDEIRTIGMAVNAIIAAQAQSAQ